MTMEAKPAYEFTIPSIADDTVLDCRIYLPRSLRVRASELLDHTESIDGAVLAHPYAPLGGCFDDSVILCATHALLEQHLIVGTFNFRGAGSSAGSTSLTGSGERDDYISFAGFMSYYLQGLVSKAGPRYGFGTTSLTTDGLGAEETSSDKDSPADQLTIGLVLGGYSYGGLVLAQLPHASQILSRFDSAAIGTSEAEIILRARTLAKETLKMQNVNASSTQLEEWQSRSNGAAARSRIVHSPTILGGEETDPSLRRRSRDSSRSNELIRKSLQVPHRVKGHLRKQKDQEGTPFTAPLRGIGCAQLAFDVRYLLISPVLLPFTSMLSPPGIPSLLTRPRRRHPARAANYSLSVLPTLAIFGSQDGFTASGRLTTWAKKLSVDSKSGNFQWCEIEGAGHFWNEAGVMQVLQERLMAWIRGNRYEE